MTIILLNVIPDTYKEVRNAIKGGTLNTWNYYSFT